MNISLYNGLHNPIRYNGKKYSNDHISFYNSKQWKQLRLHCLQSHPLCYRCKTAHIIKEATTCDHMLKWTDESDELATNIDNLYSLCHSCHASITYSEKWTTHKHLKLYKSGVPLSEIALLKYRNKARIGVDGYPIEPIA